MYQPDFLFPGIGTRVLFAPGSRAKVGDEVQALGHKTAFVLSTPAQTDSADEIAAALGTACAGTFTKAAMHTPVDVSERAVAAFKDSKADCVAGIGGGSTVGLAKAIATRTGCDQIVIPTTYAGSEMTDILGETENGVKTTRRDPSIRPEVVIYDAELTVGLPTEMTVTSSLNAIAHAIEGLYATDANPITSMMAVEAVKTFQTHLPKVLDKPGDVESRGAVLYAAWLCSTALGYVSMALHHKLAHTMGGSFGLPHADTHAILLPHTAGFNFTATQDQLAPVADLFGGSVGAGLWRFAKDLGAPLRLKDLGISEQDVEKASEIAVSKPYPNPRQFDRSDIRSILMAAWEGQQPTN